MRLMDKMKQKRMENKGFTLVELIIVMAIMAVLLGIVGTQVIPYLEKAREAKDLQVINSYCTAAVTIYSIHGEDSAVLEDTGADLWYSVYKATKTKGPEYYDKMEDNENASVLASYFTTEMKEYVGHVNISDLNGAMKSKKGQTIDDVLITINYKNGEITAQAVSDGTLILDPVISYIGSAGK